LADIPAVTAVVRGRVKEIQLTRSRGPSSRAKHLARHSIAAFTGPRQLAFFVMARDRVPEMNINIEALCAAPPEAFAHSPSQMQHTRTPLNPEALVLCHKGLYYFEFECH